MLYCLLGQTCEGDSAAPLIGVITGQCAQGFLFLLDERYTGASRLKERFFAAQRKPAVSSLNVRGFRKQEFEMFEDLMRMLHPSFAFS